MVYPTPSYYNLLHLITVNSWADMQRHNILKYDKLQKSTNMGYLLHLLCAQWCLPEYWKWDFHVKLNMWLWCSMQIHPGMWFYNILLAINTNIFHKWILNIIFPSCITYIVCITLRRNIFPGHAYPVWIFSIIPGHRTSWNNYKFVNGNTTLG